jgi:hypothetical protein
MNRLLIFLSFLLFLSPGKSLCDETFLPFERVTVSISMDTSDWVIGHEKVLTELTLIEWVPKGETVEHWSSQFRALRYANALMASDDARILAKQFVEKLSHGCKNPEAVRHEILEADSTSALILWESMNCKSDDPYTFDQKELTRFIIGDEFTFNLAFTRRLGADLRPETGPALLTEQDQLAVLRSAAIRQSEVTSSAYVNHDELMRIPAYRAYALFDDPENRFGRVWFEEVERKGTGRSATVSYRLKSEALPPDHWYAVYFIKLPEGLVIPVQYGLKLGENAELTCPPVMEAMPEINSVTGDDFANTGFAKSFPCGDRPNRSINDTLSFSAGEFQSGLAIGAGVQSHDASHRYLARAIPRSIQGQDLDCRIELELASPDGRSYLLRGSGFEPGEALDGSWQYAKNTEDLRILVLGDGSFIYPLFHTGKAKGSRKWQAEIQLRGSRCSPGINYFWGKKGMTE